MIRPSWRQPGSPRAWSARKVATKSASVPVADGLAQAAHQVLVVPEIVPGQQHGGQDLVRLDQVVEVGAAVVARRPGRPSRRRAARGSSAWRAFRRLSVPKRVKAWPVRPERVGSTQSNMSMPRSDGAHDVGGLADAHEVARPVGRQERARSRRASRTSPPAARRRRGRRWRSRRSRSPASAAAERGAQLGIGAALDDAEEAVAGPRHEGGLASARPSASTAPSRARPRRAAPAAAGTRRAHRDVGVEQVLDLDRALRRQLVAAAVDVRAERRRRARRASARAASDITW